MIWFLYARPQTGRTFVLWYVMSVHPPVRPSVRVSVRQSQFSALFSYMFRHIELKFCMWLSSYVPSIKSSISVNFYQFYVGVMPLLELWILEIHSFPRFFPYMLWHIELKFCIWLCYTVPQIKIEFRQLASMFVGVMPLLELRIMEINSCSHFSPSCFDILSWNCAYDFVILHYRSRSSVVNLRQFL